LPLELVAKSESSESDILTVMSVRIVALHTMVLFRITKVLGFRL